MSRQVADIQRAPIIVNQELLQDLRNQSEDQFTIMGLNGELHQIQVTRIIEQIDGDWSLLGHIDGNWMDSFSLSFSDGEILSSVRAVMTHHFLEIRFDESQNEHYLFQIDPHERDELFCGFDHDNIVEVPEDGSVEMGIREDPGPQPGSTVIDILIVYTPAAQAWAAVNGGGINNVINQAMAISQNSVDNSQINLQFRLVHRSAVEYVETGNSRTDLDNLTNRVIPGVQQLRNQHAADLVVMLTDTEDMGGIAWLTTNPNGTPAYGYSITRVQQAAWTTTMVHEIAHNMGSHHSRNQDIQPAPERGGVFNYSTGWRWTGADNQSFSTIMTYPQSSTAVDLFSNPNITFQGAPTGSNNGEYAPANNTKSLIEMMHVVANYRTEGTVVSSPTVSTSTISNVLSTSAQTGGVVLDDGGIAVTSRGVCWSTEPNPSLSDRCRNSGSGMGSFEVTLTNLTVNTTYYIRAFATNSEGTSYGTQRSFRTIGGLPAVSTAPVREISFKSAIGAGLVTDPGSSAVTERGVCWSIRRNPGLSDNCRSTAPGTGAFSTLIDQLIRDTIYYVRAYATNGQGTSFGEERSFVTLPVIVDSNQSTITVSTDKVQANNQNYSVVTVTARDFEGTLLPGFDTQLISKQGTPQITPNVATTNSQGEASFVISNSKAEQVTIGAISGNIELSATSSVQFIGIDAQRSSIGASSTIVQADGIAEARITVTARDQDNNPFSNLRVELIPDGGSSAIRAIRQSTDVNGEAIFSVSNQVTEQVRYRARGLGTTIISSAEVIFVSIDPDRSSVTADVKTVAADGDDAAMITVKAIDINNEAIQGVLIRLTDGGAGTTISPREIRTDADGLVRFEIRNSSVAKVEYTAIAIRPVANVPLREKVSIAFIPAAPITLSASEVGTRSFQANWELGLNADSYLLDVAKDSSFTNYLSGYESRDVGRVTSYRVTDANPGTDYVYRVRSIVGGLNSADSTPVRTTTIPETPVAIGSSDQNARTFIANWQESAGARNYRIDVSRDAGFSEILPDYNNRNAGHGRSFEVGGLETGRIYYYRVRAEAGTRNSANSNSIAATTLTANPDNSVISQQQSRILANGNQSYEVDITVKSEGSVLLKGLNVELIQSGTESLIEAVQSETDSKGIARFQLSSINAGITSYEVYVDEVKIGEFEVEYLSDEGVLSLGSNYPNPFVNSTILPVTIPSMMDVNMQIFDILGKPVQTLIVGILMPGYYEVVFEGYNLSAGVYICRLVAGGKVLTERMVKVN